MEKFMKRIKSHENCPESPKKYFLVRIELFVKSFFSTIFLSVTNVFVPVYPIARIKIEK